MTLINLTNVSESANILDLTVNINNITGGWLGIFILMSFFIIMVAGFRGQALSTRISTSAFITAIVSFLFRASGVITNDWIPVIFILILAGSWLAGLYTNQ